MTTTDKSLSELMAIRDYLRDRGDELDEQRRTIEANCLWLEVVLISEAIAKYESIAKAEAKAKQ